MKRAAALVIAAACAASPSAAQSALDGTWKLDPASTHVSGTRFDIALQDGVFTCRWCSPVWSIPADGAFHPVKGHSYDEASVRVIDSRSAAFARRRNGRTYYQAVDIISEDQSRLTFSYMEVSNSGHVETGIGLWSRVAPIPKGAHSLTGQWQELWVKSDSDEPVEFGIAIKDDVLHLQIGPAESLTATFNGPAASITGDSRGTTASVRKLGDSAFVQTDYRKDKLVSTTTYKLTGPTTLEIEVDDSGSKTKSRYTARKN